MSLDQQRNVRICEKALTTWAKNELYFGGSLSMARLLQMTRQVLSCWVTRDIGCWLSQVGSILCGPSRHPKESFSWPLLAPLDPHAIAASQDALSAR